jgi:hypothetical protein
MRPNFEAVRHDGRPARPQARPCGKHGRPRLNYWRFAPVAQGIEQRFPKPRVGGSNPSRRTLIFLIGKGNSSHSEKPRSYAGAPFAATVLQPGLPPCRCCRRCTSIAVCTEITKSAQKLRAVATLHPKCRLRAPGHEIGRDTQEEEKESAQSAQSESEHQDAKPKYEAQRLSVISHLSGGLARPGVNALPARKTSC